jgi:hypothetical protein
MSQEKVEVVLDQYAATNERDFRRAMSYYDDDVELVAGEPWLRTGVFKGREAVVTGLAIGSARSIAMRGSTLGRRVSSKMGRFSSSPITTRGGARAASRFAGG